MSSIQPCAIEVIDDYDSILELAEMEMPCVIAPSFFEERNKKNKR